MKTLYKKGMTVEEIKQAADEQGVELRKMSIYLNEAGVAAADTHHIISWEATFSETIEELIDNLNEHIEKEHVNDRVKKNIKHFIKNFLQ